MDLRHLARSQPDRVTWCPKCSRASRVAVHVAVSRAPAVANGSAAGAVVVGLHARMLAQVSARAAELAGVAGYARIAGLTCERSYDHVRSAAR